MEPVFEGDGWPEPRVVTTFDELLEALSDVAAAGWPVTPPDRERPGVAPLDGHAAWRFAQRVRGLSLR